MRNTLLAPLRRRRNYTNGQVARMCGVAPRTVAKWFDSGRIKGYRIPGSLDRRYPHDELLGFLKENGLPVPPELAAEPHLLVYAAAGRLDDLPELAGADTRWVDSPFALGLALAAEPPAALLLDYAVGAAHASCVLRRAAGLARPPLAFALAAEDAPLPGADLALLKGSWEWPCDLALVALAIERALA